MTKKYLTPPNIDSQSILTTLECIRPMRDGNFNISIEQLNNKTIVNCYGHGGSGWTTLFGSVKCAVNIFKKRFPSSKDCTIRVIGSGCMGLLSAIELCRLGYSVSGITSSQLYDTASWQAAGYFALVSIKTTPQMQKDVDDLGIATLHTCQQIEQGNHPYLMPNSIRKLPVYSHQQTASGLENVQKRGLLQPAVPVTLDFGNGVVHPNFVENTTYFMNTTQLMQQFLDQIGQLGIPIEIRKIEAFNDIDDPVIFNCSGMGGRSLNNDDLMIPVRGHLIILNALAGTAHLDYMIYTDMQQEDRQEHIYLFPKTMMVSSANPNGIACCGSLGGTFIPNLDQLSEQELKARDQLEIERLLDRSSLFFNGKPFEKTLELCK